MSLSASALSPLLSTWDPVLSLPVSRELWVPSTSLRSPPLLVCPFSLPDMGEPWNGKAIPAFANADICRHYSTGPLLWSPLTEIPAIGRNPPYMITLIIFVILQVPTALVNNFAGLCVLRFLAGFFGSPPLATGGASLQDMYSIKTRTFALGMWGVAASGGPSLGPIVSGFAIQANGWRWAFWIMLWLAGGAALFLAFFLPEVSRDWTWARSRN